MLAKTGDAKMAKFILDSRNAMKTRLTLCNDGRLLTVEGKRMGQVSEKRQIKFSHVPASKPMQKVPFNDSNAS